MSQSQIEEKKAWFYAFRNLKHGIFTSINVAFVAKVVKYDRSKHIADIQPLADLSNGQKSAQILDVPVAESCYILDEVLDRLKPEFSHVDSHAPNSSNIVGKYPAKHFMRVGVPVVAVCLDRDNDNWSGNAETYQPNTGRVHSINDCIVVAVLGGNAANG